MNQAPFHGELEAASQAAFAEPGKSFTARLIPVSVLMQPRPFHQVGKTTGIHLLVEDDGDMDGQPTIQMSFYMPRDKEPCRGCPYEP